MSGRAPPGPCARTEREAHGARWDETPDFVHRALRLGDYPIAKSTEFLAKSIRKLRCRFMLERCIR